MSEEKSPDIVAVTTKAELALDAAAAVVSVAPWVGRPISSVPSGISTGRRIQRVKEVLDGLAQDLKNFKSEVCETYVRKDEFEDLLANTLRSAADERNQEKRRTFRALLSHAIKSPGDEYDDQIRLLSTLESLHPDHLRVTRALLLEPEPDPGNIGSPIRTLEKRIPELSANRIREVAAELDNMGITTLSQSLMVMMTGPGAANLQNRLTRFGRKLIEYIRTGI